jgi:hypothetical protein
VETLVQLDVTGTGAGRRTFVAAVVIVGVSVLLLAGCGSGKKSGLVGYPSWLPKNTLHVHADALVVGTASNPALTNQGDPVEATTPHWSVRAVVTGPEVPGEGLPYQAPSTTCTFTVTLTGATRPVPVSVGDFDVIDQAGVFQPGLVPGQPAPPSLVEPGKAVVFELRAGLPTGEGLMRWAPIGGHILAKWDFVVEND